MERIDLLSEIQVDRSEDRLLAEYRINAENLSDLNHLRRERVHTFLTVNEIATTISVGLVAAYAYLASHAGENAAAHVPSTIRLFAVVEFLVAMFTAAASAFWFLILRRQEEHRKLRILQLCEIEAQMERQQKGPSPRTFRDMHRSLYDGHQSISFPELARGRERQDFEEDLDHGKFKAPDWCAIESWEFDEIMPLVARLMWLVVGFFAIAFMVIGESIFIEGWDRPSIGFMIVAGIAFVILLGIRWFSLRFLRAGEAGDLFRGVMNILLGRSAEKG